MAQETQLPVGGVVDHDGRALRIVKLLTDKGLTSRVYEGWLASEDQSGEVHVAIKAMKLLDFPMARQSFEQEGFTLASMKHYEEKANEEQGLNLKIAPAYFGSGTYEDDVPYLVMEYIVGKEIPDLLHEKGGKLPEAQALTVAWHLLRTLDLLHSHLKKTYVDLKYENMWWVRSEGEIGGQLKLLDFGTLEDIKPGEQAPRGVRRDLLQSGVYLCDMLTGQLPDYSMVGYLRDPRGTDKIIRQHKEEMSWGAHQLLARLLHRNPQARPTSAKELAKELRQLVGFWTSPLEDVLRQAQRLLMQAEGEEDTKTARNFAEDARAALDIARLRSSNDESVPGDIERAEKVLAISDYLERGKKLLQTRSPDLARKVFEEGMHWSENPGVLRRWAYLARVGEKVSPTVFDEHCTAAMQMLDWMNSGDWKHALERLEQLRPDLQSEGLDLLYADANLFMKIAEAESFLNTKNHPQAAFAYREAQGWMDKLPDAEFVKQEEEGDLYERAVDAEWFHETEGKAETIIAEAEALLRQEDPDYELILQKAKNAVRIDPQKKDWFVVRQLAEYLLVGEQTLIKSDQKAFMKIIYQARSTCGSNASTESAIRHLRNRAALRVIETKDGEWLEELARLAEEQGDSGKALEWRNQIQQWAGQRNRRLEKAIDQLITEATAIWQFDTIELDQIAGIVTRYPASEIKANFEQNGYRLGKADDLVAAAELMAEEINYRRDDIETLRRCLNQTIDQERERTANWLHSIREVRQERLKMLDRSWEELKRFLKLGRQAESVGANVPVCMSIARQAEEDAQELIRQCLVYLATLDASNTHVRSLLDSVYQEIDGLGVKGWESLQQLAAEQIKKIGKEFQQARLYFERGELASAAAEVDRLAADFSLAPEWLDLKTRLAQAEMWQAWQREKQDDLETGWLDADLLKSLRGYILLGLPAVYYQNAAEYLKRVYSTAESQVKSQLRDIESSDFIHAMRLWMDVGLTSRMIRSLKNSSIE